MFSKIWHDLIYMFVFAALKAKQFYYLRPCTFFIKKSEQTHFNIAKKTQMGLCVVNKYVRAKLFYILKTCREYTIQASILPFAR